MAAIDVTSFFLIVGTLAAGGVGGYYYHEKTNRPPPPPPEPPPVTTITSAAPPPAPAAPACDDSVGAADDCPPLGLPSASSEGLCGGYGSLAAKRCKDYKAAFKPKVAEMAVGCLRKLRGSEVCQAARVNRCGHEALMLACQEPVPVERTYVSSFSLATAAAEPASAGAAPSGTPPPPPSPVTAQCEAVLRGCAGTFPGVTLVECVRTLSGMNDTGRAAMMSCMRNHCADKGLSGCEAVLTHR